MPQPYPTDWNFNPNFQSAPYLVDDTRFLVDATDMTVDGIGDLDPQYTWVNPTNWSEA